MTTPAALLDAVKKAIAFEPHKDRAGNLAWGKGTLDGKPVRLAMVENRFASGSIGRVEAERLGALFKIAVREKSPVILHLDSAGAKISEGLAALGAFRALYRAGLDAVAGGAHVAAILGANCFGGSSMLAHLAPRRLFSPQTRLAMSGPAILAAAAGMDALDEMFRAMADATLAASARAKASPGNQVWEPGSDVAGWLRETLADAGDPRVRHAALAGRIAKEPARPMEPVRRKDLERIYDGDYEAREGDGLLCGRGKRAGHEEAFVGLVGHRPVGAARAWRFAELAWKLAERPPARVEVYLDCASHAPKLEDERIVLSEFIAGMSLALSALRQRAAHVGLTILTQAGGGVYVALAAPASHVASLHGAEIQVLPGAAVAAILGGENPDAVPGFDEYRKAGVADEELKIGVVPDR